MKDFDKWVIDPDYVEVLPGREMLVTSRPEVLRALLESGHVELD